MSANDELRCVLDKILMRRHVLHILRKVDGTLTISLIDSSYRHMERPRKASSDGSDLLEKIESL